MDLLLVKKGIDLGRSQRKWVILLTALGFTGYGAYRVYNLPSVAFKRRKILKLFGALVSVIEAVSDSAESFGIVSKDLKEFLQSDSDQIPNSLKQLSKIARSDEFSSSLIRLTQGLTIGLLRGYRSESQKNAGSMDSEFVEKVMDKVFSPAGSGFASVVIGSFARNLIMGFFSASQSQANGFVSDKSDHVPEWLSDLLFSDRSRDLIGDCIQVFVSTAVTVYLDKTIHVNTYDELFSGLTNSKHEDKVKDMFVTVCNGAVETLVRTSHEVLTRAEFKDDDNDTVNLNIVEEGKMSEESESDQEINYGENSGGGWASKVSNTLAVPSNRRLVLDVTGRVTFETVRSFLEFLFEKVYEGVKRCVNTIHESVVERGLYIARYVGAKSTVMATVFLSLCLNTTGSSWLLMPA